MTLYAAGTLGTSKWEGWQIPCHWETKLPPYPLASFCIFVSHPVPGHTAELEASPVQIYTHFSFHWTSVREGLINSLIYCSSGIWVQVKILRSGFGSETEECMTASGMGFAGEKVGTGHRTSTEGSGYKVPIWQRSKEKRNGLKNRKMSNKSALDIKKIGKKSYQLRLEADQLNI